MQPLHLVTACRSMLALAVACRALASQAPSRDGVPADHAIRLTADGGFVYTAHPPSMGAYSVRFGHDLSAGVEVVTAQPARRLRLIPLSLGKAAGYLQRPDRLTYPSDDGARVTYSFTPDGVKEDIVLASPWSDAVVLDFRLDLDPALAARLDGEGNVLVDEGVPAGAGLRYVIPAPVVVDGDGRSHAALACFTLDGSRLTLRASGLARLTGPVTIDPSVYVTTTADLRWGNNEGMVSFDVDAISRQTASGGRLGAWTSTAPFGVGRSKHAAVAHNGYLYVLGGFSETHAPLSDVRYGRINANGTISTWLSATAMPNARFRHHAAVYNGYLYVLGGADSPSSFFDDVIFAPINPTNGSLGDWASTTSFSTGRVDPTVCAYNGYLYILGGTGETGFLGDVQYAAFRADGQLGAWAFTTSIPGLRTYHASVAYNGNLYLIGGHDGTTFRNSVQFAPLSATGAVGSWSSTTSFPQALTSPHAAVNGGYLYVMGWSGFYVAPLHDSGRIGEFATTTVYSGSGSRLYEKSAFYNGVLYVTGGEKGTGTTHYSDVQFARPEPRGIAGAWTQVQTMPGRKGHSSVAYDGKLYVIGGSNGVADSDEVRFAAIGAGGTVGSFVTTTALPTPRSSHASLVWNGYLYVLGGESAGVRTNAVEMAAISAAGTLGPWVATTPFATARGDHASAVWNDVLYVTGGTDGAAILSDVQYAPLSSSGAVGPWTATAGLSVGRRGHVAVAYGGHLYALGGTDGTTANSDVLLAPIQPGGPLGPWTATLGFSGARLGHTAAASNGYLYVVGGTDGSTPRNDVQYAWIDASGAVGTWAGTGTFTTARESHAMAAYEGRLYLSGGASPAVQTDVQAAMINGCGNLDAWVATTSLPAARHDLAAAAQGRFLYIAGGSDGASELADVLVAAAAPDGALGPWTATTSLATARRAHALVAANGYLYVLGGSSGGLGLADVQYASLDGVTGAVGPWAPTTGLPGPRSSLAAAAWRGYLYVVGGDDGFGGRAEVYYAPILGGGTLGAWTAGTSLPGGRRAHSVAVHQGQLYVLGGDDGVARLDDVQAAPIAAGGPIGAWTAVARFDRARRSHGSIATNGYAYVIGGNDGATARGDAQVAPLASTGSIGAWSQAAPLPAPRTSHATAAAGGYVYVVGGTILGAPTTQVHYATLQGPVSRGLYSRLVDVGPSARIDAVRLTDTGNLGTTNLTYMTAAEAGGAVFGARTTIADAASAVDYTTGLGACARWIWISTDLDDRPSATVDSGATLGRGDVLEIEVKYSTGGGGGGSTQLLGWKQPPNAHLSWSVVAGASSYEVQRCNATAGPCTPATVASMAGLAWNDPVLADGNDYWYNIVPILAICP